MSVPLGNIDVGDSARKNLRRIAMLVWNTFQNDARVKNEAETLVKAGYMVIVHALHAPRITTRREYLESGVHVVRHGRLQGARQLASRGSGTRSRWGLVTLALSSLLTQVTMVWAVIRSRSDAVHAHDVNMLPAAWLAASVLRVPLIYDAHEISTGREGYAAIRSVVAWLEKCIMPRAAGTITTTEARARFFARAYSIPRPLVLQNRPRLISAKCSGRIRRELALKESWPIIIYQGGLQSGRGLLNLVRAVFDISDAYLVFVGSGGQEAALKELVQELGLETRVKFISTVPLAELPQYTASADIGVQPIENTCINHYTTDSNKLFEYMMAGLPVVATNLPEIRRVVQEYHLGLLVPSGEIPALAAALKKLLIDPSLRARYGKNACNAAGELNWEAQERGLLDLYARAFRQAG